MEKLQNKIHRKDDNLFASLSLVLACEVNCGQVVLIGLTLCGAAL